MDVKRPTCPYLKIAEDYMGHGLPVSWSLVAPIEKDAWSASMARHKYFWDGKERLFLPYKGRGHVHGMRPTQVWCEAKGSKMQGFGQMRPYLGFQRNKNGIYPIGVAFHDRVLNPDFWRDEYIRIVGLQVGLVWFSFWVAVKRKEFPLG